MLELRACASLRLLLVVSGLAAGSAACGGPDCPDLSGTWVLTRTCAGPSAPRDEQWEQNDCNVVRRSLVGEKVGSAVVGEDGTITVTSSSTAAPCSGSVQGSKIEVSCPSAVGQSCGPDSCCVARWER